MTKATETGQPGVMYHAICGAAVICRREPDPGSPLGAVTMIPYCAVCRCDVPVEGLAAFEETTLEQRLEGSRKLLAIAEDLRTETARLQHEIGQVTARTRTRRRSRSS